MMQFRLAKKILAKLLFWRQISVQRAELSRLSDELLKDIGISRIEAAREANRHFWDTAPAADGSLRERSPAELKY